MTDLRHSVLPWLSWFGSSLTQRNIGIVASYRRACLRLKVQGTAVACQISLHCVHMSAATPRLTFFACRSFRLFLASCSSTIRYYGALMCQVRVRLLCFLLSHSSFPNLIWKNINTFRKPFRLLFTSSNTLTHPPHNRFPAEHTASVCGYPIHVHHSHTRILH